MTFRHWAGGAQRQVAQWAQRRPQTPRLRAISYGERVRNVDSRSSPLGGDYDKVRGPSRERCLLRCRPGGAGLLVSGRREPAR